MILFFYKTVYKFSKAIKFFYAFLYFPPLNLRNAKKFFNILKFMKQWKIRRCLILKNLCVSSHNNYNNSVYLPFRLLKKILSCSLRFFKFLMLCILRLIVLFLRFLFYLAVLSFLFIFLTSNISCSIGSVFDVSVSCIANFMITIFNQNLRVIAIILNPGSCFQSLV